MEIESIIRALTFKAAMTLPPHVNALLPNQDVHRRVLSSTARFGSTAGAAVRRKSARKSRSTTKDSWGDNCIPTHKTRHMMANRQYTLPYGINICIEDGVANIETDLPQMIPSGPAPIGVGRLVGIVEGIEQLLLSLARVGVDLSAPEFAEAIHDCVANLQ